MNRSGSWIGDRLGANGRWSIDSRQFSVFSSQFPVVNKTKPLRPMVLRLLRRVRIFPEGMLISMQHTGIRKRLCFGKASFRFAGSSVKRGKVMLVASNFTRCTSRSAEGCLCETKPIRQRKGGRQVLSGKRVMAHSGWKRRWRNEANSLAALSRPPADWLRLAQSAVPALAIACPAGCVTTNRDLPLTRGDAGRYNGLEHAWSGVPGTGEKPCIG